MQKEALVCCPVADVVHQEAKSFDRCTGTREQRYDNGGRLNCVKFCHTVLFRLTNCVKVMGQCDRRVTMRFVHF